MADSPLISLIANPGQVQGISSGSGTQGATATLSLLNDIPSGSFMSGFVMNRDREGNPILRTEKGDLTLRSDVFLKTGSEVIIKLEKSVNDVKARIVSVDGESFYNLQSRQAPKDGADVILNSSLLTNNKDTAKTAPLSTAQQATNVFLRSDGVVNILLVSSPQITMRELEAATQNLKLPAGALTQGAVLTVKVIASDVTQAVLLQNISQAAISTLPDKSLNLPIAASPSPATNEQFYAAYQKQLFPGMMGTPPQSDSTSPLLQAAPPTSTTVTLPVTSANPQVVLPQLPTNTPVTPPASAMQITPPVATTPATPLPTEPAALPTAPAPVSVQPSPTHGVNLASLLVPQPATNATPQAAVVPTLPATVASLTGTPPPITTAALPQQAAALPVSANITQQTTALAAPADVSTVSTPPAKPQQLPVANNAANATPQGLMPQFLPGNKMEAVVIGTERSGEVVLQTPLGTVKLPMEQSLPTGTKLVVELMAISHPSTGSTVATHSPSAALTQNLVAANDSTIAELARSWPAFSELVQTVARHDIQAAELLIQKSIPQVGKQFTTGILFFLSAIKGGSPRQWLGERATQILEQTGNTELLRRVSSEFSMIRNQFTNAPDNNWQPLFIPIAHGHELTQARMYYKRDGQKDKDGKTAAAAGTRFILEIDFTEVGQIQMDGFVKKKDGRTLFDLIIRTIKALSPQMQSDITRIFDTASEMTGFKGNIQILNMKEFPINPMESAMIPGNNLIA